MRRRGRGREAKWPVRVGGAFAIVAQRRRRSVAGSARRAREHRTDGALERREVGVRLQRHAAARRRASSTACETVAARDAVLLRRRRLDRRPRTSRRRGSTARFIVQSAVPAPAARVQVARGPSQPGQRERRAVLDRRRRQRVEREHADREPGRAQTERRAHLVAGERALALRRRSPAACRRAASAFTVVWTSSRRPVPSAPSSSFAAVNGSGPQSWYGDERVVGVGDGDEVRDGAPSTRR